MSNHNNTYQQLKTVSVNRKALTKHIITNEDLSRTDLRVFLALLTELEGFSIPEDVSFGTTNKRYKDPLNFKKIDPKQIGELLNLPKKKVKESIETLLLMDILEEGESDTISKGYRFRF